jgi:two-component system CheB/CheR fusion protein
VERTLLQQYAPPCAVIDGKGEIVYVHGRTGAFLEPASGAANWNILEMAREGLRLPLSSAIRKAAKLGREVTVDRLKVKSNGSSVMINVTVRPVNQANAPSLLLVVFEPVQPSGKGRTTIVAGSAAVEQVSRGT